MFLLPAHVVSAKLRSRATAPAEIDLFNEDRRRLGVPVTTMRVLSDGSIQDIAMDDPALSTGWWAAERDGFQSWRWTNGDAVIPLPVGTAVLEVRLRETQHRYLAACETPGLSLAA